MVTDSVAHISALCTGLSCTQLHRCVCKGVCRDVCVCELHTTASVCVCVCKGVCRDVCVGVCKGVCRDVCVCVCV